jgi:hypothetical protein
VTIDTPQWIAEHPWLFGVGCYVFASYLLVSLFFWLLVWLDGGLGCREDADMAVTLWLLSPVAVWFVTIFTALELYAAFVYPLLLRVVVGYRSGKQQGD